MTPKEKMIEFCSMHRDEQGPRKKELLESLEDFLKTATFEDLNILNCDIKDMDNYPGLLLFAEAFVMLGAYGNRFYNKEE